MDDAIQTSFALKQFNAETGLSVEKLQQWQSVADEVNNSGKAVAESIKAIVSNQEKLKLGQGNISGYQLIGIDPRQNAFKILDQLREKTKGLSQGMKKNILEQMGISKELIQVLELSKEKFDAMAKGAFIIPKGAVDLIDKARASSKQLGSAVNYLKGMIAANLAPSIIKINKEIMIWIRQNKQGLIDGIKKLFDWVTRFVRAIINTVRAIDLVVKSTIGWKYAMIALLGVFALMNLPLTFLIAGIFLLIAVIEDLYLYSQGKKSLFGIMLKEIPVLEKAFKGLMKFFEVIRDAFGVMKEVMGGETSGLDKMIEKWGKLGEIIDSIVLGVKVITNPFGALKMIEEAKKPNVQLGPKYYENLEKKVFITTDVTVKGGESEEKLAEKIVEKQKKELIKADESLGGE